MQVERHEDKEEKFWFPKPENTGNSEEHSPIQKRILQELRELAELEKLDPTESEESRTRFLSRFNWTDSQITGKDREILEAAIVKFNDIFARHRSNIGMKTQFKVSLTPKDDKHVHNQILLVPMNLKEDLTVALTHLYGIITEQPFSKYASLIFAQRKPIDKLRLLVELRKINGLIADDYINNNHPVSTLSDAAQYLTGKRIFRNLDCSQVYLCLQMRIKVQ